MLVYIVEDSELKARKISEFFEELLPSTFSFLLFASYQSGLRAVENKSPDLLVLDMTLPNFDRLPNAREGKVRPLGGYDLMRKMKLKGLRTKVAVVTQLESFGDGEEIVSFKDMTERCHSEFPEIFLGSVYFDQAGTGWRDALASLIKSVSNLEIGQ
ncbi:MAG: response regulator [Elusimicrobiota bacterium]|jgi:CheY-like chemotaxis protein